MQYKTNKLANGISQEERHECEFYESIDQWWHQVDIIMKHITTFANDTRLPQFEENSELFKKQPTSKVTSQSN